MPNQPLNKRKCAPCDGPEEGHHADIRVFGWRNIEFVLSTHAVGGLSDNDFIVATKINRLLA